jgi:phage replication-related protein YjqB (UPF0714/DUF867 family)
MSFRELLTDRRSRIAMLAPHGGEIERHTAEQAELAAKLAGAVCWRCVGKGRNAYRRYHVTSTKLLGDPRFPKLATLEGRHFAHAVSFHGFRGVGTEARLVLVGGRASSAIKRGLREAIERVVADDVTVRVATPKDRWPGLSPMNLVNRLAKNGVQVEQSWTVFSRSR